MRIFLIKFRETSMRINPAAIWVLLVGFTMQAAQAADYQMLPPTFSGTGIPCTDSSGGHGTNQVLVFGGIAEGGQSAINCLNGGFTVIPPTGAANDGFVGIG